MAFPLAVIRCHSAKQKKRTDATLTFGKKINGHTIIIETVSKGRKSVHPVTAYKIPTEWYNSFYKPKAVTPNTSQTASAAERGYKAITASVSNLSQAKNKVNGRTTGGEYPRIYAEYLQNRGQSPTEGMPYAEHLLKQAEKKGNIYAKALIKAEIEKAQRSSRKADIDPSATMPTIYADYIRKHNMLEDYEDADSPNVDLENNTDSGTIEAEYIAIGKSLGAKAKNYDIELPNGETIHLTEGTKVFNIKTIAGKGRNRQIDEIDFLLERFGGNELDWQKKKGLGYVDYQGESFLVRLHWYEEPTAGKHKWKVKPDADGNWFLYED